MIFYYILIFLYFLVNILAANGKILPLNKRINVDKIRNSAPCSNYYGLFFFDNTVSGDQILLSQLNIADYFFDYAKNLNYYASVTLTSQSNYSITNNFEVVPSGDFASFNRQVNQIMKQRSTTKNVSYYDLVHQAIQLNFDNISTHSNNPAFIFVVNSNIDNLHNTSELLSFFQNLTKNKIKILGIALDPQYSLQTAELINSLDNLITFSPNDPTNYDSLISWILQKSCSHSPVTTTTATPTTTTTPSAPCNTYINIVVDGFSYNFHAYQYEKQVNLIKNSILPMWSYFGNFSTMVMHDKTSTPFTIYSSNERLVDIEQFIDRYGFSSYAGPLFYEALYSLVTYEPYYSHRKEMSTFVFLAGVDYAEYSYAKGYASELSSNGKLNIIAMGNDINMALLKQFNFSNIIQWDYSDNQIPLIQQFFKNNLKCI